MNPTPPEPSKFSEKGSLSLSIEQLENTVARYSEEAADTLRFWFLTARDRNWSLAKLASETGVSSSTLTRVLRGIYGASIDNIIEILRRAQANFVESVANPDFIDTSLARRMFAIFEKSRALSNVSIMWGKMGIGKSTIITEYHRINQSQTVVVRFPAGATFAMFVRYIAKACGIGTTGRNKSQLEARQTIIRVLAQGKRLLIVDELHQAFLTCSPDTAVRCCEYLREIADVSGCGMTVVGTKDLWEAFTGGPYKEALAQLLDRGTVQAALPDKATKGDIKSFLGHYGLPVPANDDPSGAAAIIGDIVTTNGLRKLTMHLRDGAAYANRLKETFTLSHFVEAYDAIQSLGKQ